MLWLDNLGAQRDAALMSHTATPSKTMTRPVMPAKGRVQPSDQVVAALREGVARHGPSGLVGLLWPLTWSPVMSASHGLAVNASHLQQIESGLKQLGLLETSK